MPRRAVAAAPIPVHTAYAVPIGSDWTAFASRPTLMAIEMTVATLGQRFVNLFENSSPIAQPVSKNAATMRDSHGTAIEEEHVRGRISVAESVAFAGDAARGACQRASVLPPCNESSPARPFSDMTDNWSRLLFHALVLFSSPCECVVCIIDEEAGYTLFGKDSDPCAMVIEDRQPE